MNVNLKELTEALKLTHKKHREELRGKSGKSTEWEQGFLDGLEFVREFIVPAFETMEIDEASAIESQMQNEIEDLKARHRFGLDESKAG